MEGSEPEEHGMRTGEQGVIKGCKPSLLSSVPALGSHSPRSKRQVLPSARFWSRSVFLECSFSLRICVKANPYSNFKKSTTSLAKLLPFFFLIFVVSFFIRCIHYILLFKCISLGLYCFSNLICCFPHEIMDY